MKRLFTLTNFAIFLSVSIFAASDGLKSSLLDQHNKVRAQHAVPALKWNASIAAFAKQWAQVNASKNKMHHRRPNKYGENIYWTSAGSVSGTSVVNAWYNEIKDYNYNKPGFGMSTGHFTQVIWKSSTEVGCGSAKSSRGGTYVVCNYSPPGNYRGRFKTNVLPKK